MRVKSNFWVAIRTGMKRKSFIKDTLPLQLSKKGFPTHWKDILSLPLESTGQEVKVNLPNRMQMEKMYCSFNPSWLYPKWKKKKFWALDILYRRSTAKAHLAVLRLWITGVQFVLHSCDQFLADSRLRPAVSWQHRASPGSGSTHFPGPASGSASQWAAAPVPSTA